MIQLQKIRRPSVPLHAEVADLYRNRILSGDIPTGTKLPSVDQISDELGLAKMTVRQAMDTLEAENLLERRSGRGTFAREIKLQPPKMLKMKAEMSELLSLMQGLEATVSTLDSDPDGKELSENGRLSLRRVHMREGVPFCMVELELSKEIFDRAPGRFLTEIIVVVMQSIGVDIASAKQRVTISYADLEAAKTLNVHLNSPVLRVRREFHDSAGNCAYSANLTYPGNSLGFEIDFLVSK
nr:GntR family transcriptional regulator [Yoonia sp.]